MKLIVMIFITSLCIKNITERKLNSHNHNENNSKTDGITDNGNSIKADNMAENNKINGTANVCLLYTSPSPRDKRQSRMPSSA